MDRRIPITAACLFLVAAAAGAQQAALAGARWASSIRPANLTSEKVFRPADRQANFTFFSGVENVRVEDGVLKFSLSGTTATLGWGNYMGKQKPAEVVDMFEERNDVVLNVRQSGTESTWKLWYWVDGGRMGDVQPVSAKLTGSAATIAFPSVLTSPVPDGLELQVEGTRGDRFEIQDIRLVQTRSEGYIRKEFTLPQGKVWRAIAEVGGQPEFRWYGVNKVVMRLYVNGREVKRRGNRYLYATAPVDIAPYLKPGKNCVGFYGYRVGPEGHSPMLFLQGKIVMESGEVLPLQTDATWKYSPTEKPGWNTAGFDDSGWAPATPWMLPQNDPGVLESYGYILLKNPERRDLFYRDDQDVRFEIHVPAGLKDRSPAVECVFLRTDEQGTAVPVKQERITSFTQKGSSLVFPMNAGRHPRGVYAVETRLTGSDGLSESMPAEPLVVLRRLNLKEIEGKDLFEGLDTELEDTIDFTNPKDPHPWIEAVPERGKPARAVTQPTIVTRNGMTYREAPWYFSYRFQFRHPGSFYLLEMDYPDDDYREIAVSISTKHDEMWSNSQSGVGVETGGKLFKTGRMQTLRWIHVADPGPHSIDVFTTLTRGTAAARSFRIHRIRGDLPSIGAGTERLHGIHTERCYDTSGIGMNFGIGQHRTRKEREEEEKKYTPSQRRIRYLRFLQDTTERYAQYLKFTGQNTILMGMFQYTEDNTPFEHPYEIETSRIIPSMKTFLANTLDLNDITFYAGIEWSQTRHVSLPTFHNNAQVARGADTYWMVDARGRQRYGTRASTTPSNWMHPAVPSLFRDVMSEVADKFGHLKRFRGAHVFVVATPEAGYYPPMLANDKETPFAYTYDDASFARFEKDTGVRLPVSKTDPERFAKRARAVQNESVRKRFVSWRCEKFRDFMAEGLAGLREKRKDLQLLGILGGDDDGFFKYWMSSGREFSDLLRDFAVDLDLLNRTDGLGVGRWTLSWRDNRAVQNPWYWVPKVDPRITSVYDTGDVRYVLARTSWHEGSIATAGYDPDYRGSAKLVESDWIMDWTRTRTLPQATGYHARETLIQGLIASDTNMLLYGFTDLNINVGHEQEIREAMRIVTHLPREKFQTVLNTGFDTNLVIRRLTKGDVSYLYVANPGYWHIRGTLILRTPGRIGELVGGKPVPLERRAGDLALPVSLDPYGLAAFRVDSPALEVVSYSTEKIAAAEQAHMDSIAARVEKLANDPEIRLVLSIEDREFIADTLSRAKQGLSEGRYAASWGLLTGPRFWSLWKDFLEKAAVGLARLPADFVKEAEVKKNGSAERVLTALRAGSAIRVDGKLDEADWRGTGFQSGFLDRERHPGLAETGVKALYDDKNLYLGIVCADPDTKSLKSSDSFSWSDDAVAIFLQPDEKKPVYYQLAFNPAGLQMHQKVTGGERDYTVLPHWKPAVSVSGSVWTAEVVLPFATFGLDGKGQGSWRINVHRVFRGGSVNSSSWSYRGGGFDFHNRDNFGRLRFL